MTPRRSVALCLLSFLAAAPAAAQVQDHKQLTYPPLRPFNVPRAERVVLPNGMVILLVEDHELPLVDGIALIRAGDRLDPADRIGLATLTVDVMRTGGTTSMTGDQVDEFLEKRAASIELGSVEDYASARLSCLKEDFPAVLKLFVEILRSPAFAEEKLKIARNEMTAGIARRNDQPQGIIAREFDKLIYGADSPYARVPEYATVNAITRDDLVAFHKKHVHPNRMVLGLSGDFAAKEMAATLRAAFKDWPRGPAGKDPEAAYQSAVKPGFYQVVKEDMTQSEIAMGHIGIRRDNPDYFAVEVLNEVFGGGFSARLFSNVRSRKGLAYRVRGAVGSSYDHPGTFRVSMSTKTETTAAGIDALYEEIEGIVKSPPSQDELARAKEAILNSFVFNFDSPEKVLVQQTTYEYFGYPSDFLVRYRGEIEKVTAADVARVAAKYIHKDRMAVLVVGPSKGQDRPLSSFGGVAVIDITIPEPKAATSTGPAATDDTLRKGREVFAKAVEGMGGGRAVDAVKAIRQKSSGTRNGPQGEMAVKVSQTIAFPDRLRQELTLPIGQIVVTIAGAVGAMQTPMGPQPLPDSQRAEIAKQLRRNLVMLAQRRDDEKVTFQHVGVEPIAGSPADVLLVTLEGDPFRLFVDQTSGQVVRQVYEASGPQGPGEVTVNFSDFRSVAGGLTLAHRTESILNGSPQSNSTVEEIVVNPDLSAILFESPAEEEEGEEEGS